VLCHLDGATKWDANRSLPWRTDHAHSQPRRSSAGAGRARRPQVAGILALDPSLAELEEALVAASGDEDALAQRGRGLSARAAQIVEILTDEEDDDR